jgi:hypothetical protein
MSKAKGETAAELVADFRETVRKYNAGEPADRTAPDIVVEQSDAMLLHCEIGNDYRTELHYETGHYTVLILHFIQHDPASKRAPTLSRESTPAPIVDDSRDTRRDKSDALLLVQKHVKKHLKAPSTAEFPGMFDDRPVVRSLGSNKFRIRSWVDAENGFGATIRMNYDYTVETDGQDGWRVLSFEMDE